MGVFKRVSDIISANFSDMVEKFETPEAMLRQAIREMDTATGRVMESAARVIADERMLERETAGHRAAAAAHYGHAREALLRGDDNAARRALSRRLDHETLLAALEDQLVKARAAGGKLRRQLDAMRVRKTEAERSLHVLVARQRAADAKRHLQMSVVDFATSTNGFARFEQISAKIERNEAESDALLELVGGGDSDDLSANTDNEIEAQLQTLKKECHL